jgi:hypothetical protein
VVSFAPRPLYLPEKDPSIFVGWAPEPVWACGEEKKFIPPQEIDILGHTNL